MIPREPPRRPQLGFLYIPPYRIQGLSIAGEETVVQIPELDLCFDVGLCPRAVLTSNFVALSHGHMDHAAALSYYFSQRHFQGMGVGTLFCHPDIAQPIHNIMKAWIELEAQHTPYHIIPIEPDSQVEFKRPMALRAFATKHTVPSLGYIVVEMRSKLKSEYVGLPQEKLVELKSTGHDITEIHEIPLVTYTGDTMWGEHFDRDDVLNSKILITECTFIETEHRSRASVGKHLHLEHIVHLLDRCRCEAVVLVHMSRRTQQGQIRQAVQDLIPERHQSRVFILMDGRTNRKRYEQQVLEAQAKVAEQADVSSS